MRPTIIALIAVIVVGGGIFASAGFLNNEKYVETSEMPTDYENLQNYKTELERINQFNLEILEDLENQIKNSDNEELSQLQEELKVLERVIDDNKKELEGIIDKLAKMESTP